MSRERTFFLVEYGVFFYRVRFKYARSTLMIRYGAETFFYPYCMLLRHLQGYAFSYSLKYTLDVV